MLNIIEFTGGKINFSQMTKNSLGIVEVRYKAVKVIQGYTPEQAAPAILEIIRDVDFIGPVIAVFPRSSVILRPMVLPTSRIEEIRGMTALNAAQLVPCSPEDISASSYILEKTADHCIRVITSILLRPLCGYEGILKSANLSPKTILLSSSGLVAVFYEFWARKGRAAETPVMLICLENQAAEIIFCQGQCLFFSRSVPFPQDPDDNNNKEELLKAVQWSHRTYEKEKLGKKINQIFILGEGERLGELKTDLARYLAIPAEILSFQEILKILQIKTPPLSMVSLGGAFDFWRNPRPFNIMSDQFLEKQKSEAITRELKRLGITCLIFVFLFLFFRIGGFYGNSVMLKKLELESKADSPRVQAAERKIRLMDWLGKISRNSAGAIAVEKLLYDLPAEISLQELAVKPNGQIAVAGSCPQKEILEQWREKLSHSKQMEQVILEFPTRADDAFSFKITANFIQHGITKDDGTSIIK